PAAFRYFASTAASSWRSWAKSTAFFAVGASGYFLAICWQKVTTWARWFGVPLVIATFSDWYMARAASSSATALFVLSPFAAASAVFAISSPAKTDATLAYRSYALTGSLS